MLSVSLGCSWTRRNRGERAVSDHHSHGLHGLHYIIVCYFLSNMFSLSAGTKRFTRKTGKTKKYINPLCVRSSLRSRCFLFFGKCLAFSVLWKTKLFPLGINMNSMFECFVLCAGKCLLTSAVRKHTDVWLHWHLYDACCTGMTFNVYYQFCFSICLWMRD